MSDWVEIDGLVGEGGGQILRTSLALAIITQRPLALSRIRAGRQKPGLRAQHLTCVKAAAMIANARVDGAHVGATALTFEPQAAVSGRYHFDVGTAGSTTLVAQTVLPPLMRLQQPSEIVITGGTHNRAAPPYDFVHDVFVPVVNSLGFAVAVQLDRHGFYPAGGGQITLRIDPATSLTPLRLLDRGELTRRQATAAVSRLPQSIAERELKRLSARLHLGTNERTIRDVSDSRGPGNAVWVQLEFEHARELFAAFGERGRRAEAVADDVADQVCQYLNWGVPVGEHLADQLLLPMALAGGGEFLTGPLTEHSRTNMEVIQRFLDIHMHHKADGNDRTHVTVGCAQ